MVQSLRPVRILGVDPGTTRLGYAVLEGSAAHPLLVASGVVGDATLSREARLLCIFSGLTRLLEIYKPDAIALEKLFFSKNAKTALSVAEARGIILLTAKIANLTVYEYAPSEIKIAATGNGAASKRDVARMLEILLGSIPAGFDDESDAIAIALTGLVTNQYPYS